jgi:hypothetical protein
MVEIHTAEIHVVEIHAYDDLRDSSTLEVSLSGEVRSAKISRPHGLMYTFINMYISCR